MQLFYNELIKCNHRCRESNVSLSFSTSYLFPSYTNRQRMLLLTDISKGRNNFIRTNDSDATNWAGKRSLVWRRRNSASIHCNCLCRNSSKSWKSQCLSLNKWNLQGNHHDSHNRVEYLPMTMCRRFSKSSTSKISYADDDSTHIAGAESWGRSAGIRCITLTAAVAADTIANDATDSIGGWEQG